ncbi:response regulator transcription factor [Streptococcus sciuri]|uniref:Response regulator transcription factor n=1 Tax=Streptococcus sciuri TaxID=2973939 RepID=A0ABT2F8Q2_9STRE|nr:response regulator transcription factor [Streptococcus sciuri]MCS4488856.1 response regulator transcription factor [Streptococcus sciuri]
MKKKVLIIEAEKSLARLLSLELMNEGHIAEIAHSAQSGLKRALEKEYNLILLDLGVSNESDKTLIHQLQEKQSGHIIIIMSRDSALNAVSVLEDGADAYVTRPFAIGELMAHVHAIFRRQNKINQDSSIETKVIAHDLVLNKQNRSVRRGNREIPLTKREFDLLSILLQNVGQAMSRESLLEGVWQYDLGAKTNVVDVYVRYLRGKIDVPGKDSLIQTVRGVGYIIRDN